MAQQCARAMGENNFKLALITGASAGIGNALNIQTISSGTFAFQKFIPGASPLNSLSVCFNDATAFFTGDTDFPTKVVKKLSRGTCKDTMKCLAKEYSTGRQHCRFSIRLILRYTES